MPMFSGKRDVGLRLIRHFTQGWANHLGIRLYSGMSFILMDSGIGLYLESIAACSSKVNKNNRRGVSSA